MTIYRLWIVSLRDKSVIYSKYFPHLEKKDGYVFPWITAQEFVKCLYISLGIDQDDKSNVSQKNVKESTMSLFPYDGENSMLKYRDRSSTSSSTCSLSSMTSLMSNATLNSSTVSRQTSMDSSFLSESNILKEYICLYNHLPLIVCPLVNLKKQENTLVSLTGGSGKNDPEEQKKPGMENLVMLVFEQHGYLFVCCPRLSTTKTSDQIMKKANDCYENEKFTVQEASVSLAYTTLHMIATMFFQNNKSIRSMEWFISTYLPFGTLIKTRADEDIVSSIPSNPNLKDVMICLRLSESVSNSFQTSTDSEQNSEKIFGTITVDFMNSRQKFTKAEIITTIDNLGSLSLVLPTNCVCNENSIVYDVNHRSQYNLNVIHYKVSKDEDEQQKSYPGSLDASQPPNGGFKLFRTKYKIYHRKMATNVGSNSFINSQNMNHISLRILLNEKMSFEDVKFKYFMVKFSLNSGLSKKHVQTMNNSINNSLIRESVHINQGQVKNENNMLVWIIGQKMPKSKKLSIDFDLVIARENLANLDTQCNFSYNFQFQSPFIMKNFKLQPSKNDERYRLKECKITPSNRMIVPYVKLSKIALVLETPLETDSSEQSGKTIDREEYLQVNYHLNSFEYKLLPKILDTI